MNVSILYNQSNGNGKEEMHICHVSQHMFDESHHDRQLLKSMGIDFKSDQETLDWIIKKDIPEGVQYHVMNKSDLPKDWDKHPNRNNFLFDHGAKKIKGL